MNGYLKSWVGEKSGKSGKSGKSSKSGKIDKIGKKWVVKKMFKKSV